MPGGDGDGVDPRRERPRDRDEDGEQAERERGPGGESGVGPALAARREDDEDDEREQAREEGVDRARTVVGAHVRRRVGEDVRSGQCTEDGQAGDDTDRRGDPQVVHARRSDWAGLNRGVPESDHPIVHAARRSRNPHMGRRETPCMVGLGDTKQKIQNMIDTAEKLYAKMNEVRNDVDELRNRVEQTSDQVDTMSHELAEQRAVIEALAEQEGIDVDQVIADAVIEDAEEAAETTDAAADASDESATTSSSADGHGTQSND